MSSLSPKQEVCMSRIRTTIKIFCQICNRFLILLLPEQDVMGCLEGRYIVVINLLLKILKQFDFYNLLLGLKLIRNKGNNYKKKM